MCTDTGVFRGPFFSGLRSNDWQDFSGLSGEDSTCLQCGQKFQGRHADDNIHHLKAHIEQFHSTTIYMCPLPTWCHAVPVVSHNLEAMQEHLRSGHRTWVMGDPQEQRSVDLSRHPFHLEPLAFDYKMLDVPFIPLGRYNGYVSLSQKELESPFRLQAAAFFNKEANLGLRREQRFDHISRWMWTGDLPKDVRKSILKSKLILFDFPLEPVENI